MAATAQIRPLEKEQILDFLREHKAFFQTEFGIVNVGLFGSFARGEATAKSDVDVLFDYAETAHPSFEIDARFQNFIRRRLRRKVDIAQAKWLNQRLKSHILASVIYV